MSAQFTVTPDPIEPFWNRLREISLYPTHMGAMTTIIALSLCRLVTYLPLGWLFGLLVTVAMYKYAFECLRATANGHLQPPEIGMSMDDSVGWKQIWLLVIFILFAVLGVVLLGPVGGSIFGVFLGFSLPGATMTLAMEESLGSALNPGKWLGIAGRIGWPYLAVVLLCLVVIFSESYAALLVSRFLPKVLALIVVDFIGNYGLVVTFHLMGYLIYQYHAELGVEPSAPQLQRTLVRADPDQEVLDEVGAMVRDGNPEAATEKLRAQLRSRGGTPAVHTQYRKLLRLTGDTPELLRHGQEYLGILMAQDKDRLALELLRECQALEPTFAPPESSQITHLAQQAASFGQPQVALRLLSGFHKRFPNSKDIPRNYLLVATLLHERMNEDDKALALLKYLKGTFPQHELDSEIDSRIALIERMRAPIKPPPAA